MLEIRESSFMPKSNKSYKKFMKELVPITPVYYEILTNDTALSDLLVKYRLVSSSVEFYNLTNKGTIKIYNHRTQKMEKISEVDDAAYLFRKICWQTSVRVKGLVLFRVKDLNYLIYFQLHPHGHPDRVYTIDR